MLSASDLTTIIVSVAGAAIALFAALWSARSARASERSAIQQTASHGLAAVRQVVLEDYLERKFRATKAPEIDGETVELLRDARKRAMAAYERDPEEWDRMSKYSNEDAWQNKVAFEISWALNHVALYAFAGMVPLAPLLAIAGDVIIEDWLLCQSWIKSYRADLHDSDIVVTTDGRLRAWPTSISHRWHAQWLAFIAALWMHKYWPQYADADRVAGLYGGMQNLPLLVQRFSKQGEAAMPNIVRSAILSLIGVRIQT